MIFCKYYVYMRWAVATHGHLTSMCNLPVCCCTDSFGAAYSNVQVYSNDKRLVGSRVYIPTCLSVARDKDRGSLLLCFQLCTRKVEHLYNWIYIVIWILLQ
jgi:hypothetical protein